MSTITRATRVPLQIGDISINAYLLADGETIVLAGRNVTDAVNQEHKELTRFYKVRSLKNLPGSLKTLAHRSRNSVVSADDIGTKTAETLTQQAGAGFTVQSDNHSFICVSIEDAVEYWANAGGEKGKTLVIALAIETIERRVFNKLGREISLEERNKRIVARMQNRQDFHPVLTSAIAKHLKPATSYEWAKLIRQFQDKVGIRTGTRDQLNVEMQVKLTVSQQVVAKCLNAGLTWKDSLDTIH